MRLMFMGTPDFSVPVLAALIEAGHEIAAVYCQPPRPAGRGKKDRPTPVHKYAAKHGLEIRHPTSLKEPVEQQAFADLDADAAVVVAYGLILPQTVLDAPRLGCLNIHASLLPRWRGAAPIHRAIMSGDATSGVCIMQMEAGLDTGPVLLRRDLTIEAEDTTGALHNRLSDLGAQAIVEALAQIETLSPQIQSEAGVTYAQKIDKAEALIDWTRPAVDIDRQIRGLSPFPGAWTTVAGERVKLLASTLSNGQGHPGEVIDQPLTIACGQGSVKILRLQRAGKSAGDTQDVVRGWALDHGTRLGE